MSLKNALYIVSIPIGNPDDITLRAIKVLTEVDILVCEEYRNGSRLMKQLGIKDKQIITTNEHNESQQIDTLLIELAQGKSLALVSDCGTPLFSDPGHRLVESDLCSEVLAVAICKVSERSFEVQISCSEYSQLHLTLSEFRKKINDQICTLLLSESAYHGKQWNIRILSKSEFSLKSQLIFCLLVKAVFIEMYRHSLVCHWVIVLPVDTVNDTGKLVFP